LIAPGAGGPARDHRHPARIGRTRDRNHPRPAHADRTERPAGRAGNRPVCGL